MCNLYLRKRDRILIKAIRLGCDYDGDVMYYHGIRYMVDIGHWRVEKTEIQPYEHLPWCKRLWMTHR